MNFFDFFTDPKKEDLIKKIKNKTIDKKSLSNIDLKYADLENVNLNDSVLDDAKLVGINFKGTQLENASLKRVDFKSADLEAVTFENADLQNANFENASLQGSNLKNANLKNAIFKRTKLYDSNLNGANLKEAHLIHVNANNSLFENAILNGAIVEHSFFEQAHMEDADLSFMYGSNNHFKNADLTNANLTHSNLPNTNFENVNFENANMNHVTLLNCNLEGANLNFTNLELASLNGCNLRGATFIGAQINGIFLSDGVILNTGTDDNEVEPVGSGIAFEIHNAYNKINMVKYVEIISTMIPDKPDFFYNNLNLLDFINTKFIDFINTSFDKEDKKTYIPKWEDVYDKLKTCSSLNNLLKIQIGKTIIFVFDQSKNFIELYIKTFITDTFHAYEGEGNNISCIGGIIERFITILGDTLFIDCDGKECTEQQIQLLTLMKKVLNKNDLTQEWAEVFLESNKLKKMSVPERKQHYIDFMEKKYKYAGLESPENTEMIKEEADKFDYVFEGLSFGGRKKRKTKKTKKHSKKQTKRKQSKNRKENRN